MHVNVGIILPVGDLSRNRISLAVVSYAPHAGAYIVAVLDSEKRHVAYTSVSSSVLS